jgi:tRNA pseudouridine13 synthase
MEGAGSLPDWVRVDGVPECSGKIRVRIEDFRVEEIPLITPANQGSHLWLEIEKRGANTDWIARQLASQAGVSGRDIGYAGMKDRHGVTRQWFSIALQEARDSDWESWNLPDATILKTHLHSRKLKRGALRGNRFRLVVRNLDGESGPLPGRLLRVSRHGVPNYFGPQRFGHGGLNVARGAHWLQHRGRLPRNKKSIYLSAVRSFLFNEVLARRVEKSCWNQLLDGDIASLDGSHSTFPCELPDSELDRRCNEFDLHPSGPLPGGGGARVERSAALIEQAVLDAHEAMVEGLERAGIKMARRSLRLLPKAMHWEISGTDLSLEFELPPGGYATSVLRELVTTDPDSISKSK